MRAVTDRNFPYLTVAIPTYGRVKQLTDLLNQIERLGAHPDLSFEVVDDGTPDRDAIDELAQSHPNLIIRRNATNLGYAKTFLSILESAESEFVLLTADDDRIQFDNLPGFVSWLRSSDADFVSTQWRRAAGSVYRGSRTTQRIRPSSTLKSSRHAPGLCYRVTPTQQVLPFLRSALDVRSDAALVYPQVLIAVQLIAKRRGYWWAGSVVSEGSALESGIQDTSGRTYWHPESRVAQATWFETHFNDLLNSAQDSHERRALRAVRQSNRRELFAFYRQLVGESIEPRAFDKAAAQFYLREPLVSGLRHARSAINRTIINRPR